MYTSSGEFIDVHSELLHFDQVLELFIHIEKEGAVKEYCNGANAGGRWIFQIYSREFIELVSNTVEKILIESKHPGPVLEVMSGDGKLSEFLKPLVDRTMITTDAKTGRDNIEHPKWVEEIDAVEAHSKYDPSLIIISWEPFYSTTSIELVEKGTPLIWIGNPESCAVGSGISKLPSVQIDSEYLLCRHDNFTDRKHLSRFRAFLNLV
ncbi:MAG: hypothetical protein E4H14_04370 [Candidatus Thorarchaeota archaeon]|nr:MAG: hypothetical protein E4H14_04370 [Candidatus Thorarchaeota archaeon]